MGNTPRKKVEPKWLHPAAVLENGVLSRILESSIICKSLFSSLELRTMKRLQGWSRFAPLFFSLSVQILSQFVRWSIALAPDHLKKLWRLTEFGPFFIIAWFAHHWSWCHMNYYDVQINIVIFREVSWKFMEFICQLPPTVMKVHDSCLHTSDVMLVCIKIF